MVDLVGTKSPGYVDILFTSVMEYKRSNFRTFLTTRLKGFVPITAPPDTGKTMDAAVGGLVMGNELGPIYMAVSANGAAEWCFAPAFSYRS